MKLMRVAAIGIALAMGAAPVMAQSPPIPLVTGPQAPAQMNSTFNRLINQINAILVPILPAGGGLAVTPTSTGDGVVGLSFGAGANAGIRINPNGSGNITLFGDGDTGNLKFGNTTAFTKASGLVACPGAVANMPVGVAPALSGYLIVQDWSGKKHGVPTC